MKRFIKLIFTAVLSVCLVFACGCKQQAEETQAVEPEPVRVSLEFSFGGTITANGDKGCMLSDITVNDEFADNASLVRFADGYSGGVYEIGELLDCFVSDMLNDGTADCDTQLAVKIVKADRQYIELNELVENIYGSAGTVIDTYGLMCEPSVTLGGDVNGTVTVCGECNGGQYVLCTACGGTAAVTCEDCLGSGVYYCSDCDNRHYFVCGECGGTGVSDDGSECENCFGRGERTCTACLGKRDVPCELCDGTGNVECEKCDGDGFNDCSVCGGKGYVIN